MTREEAGGKEVRNAADVIEVGVGDDQGLQVRDGKIDLRPPRAPLPFLGPLEEAAVDKNAGSVAEAKFVAGAGDSVVAAVVGY